MLHFSDIRTRGYKKFICGVGICLLISALCSCSQSVNPNYPDTEFAVEEITLDKRLSVASIDDLEAISIADIPGAEKYLGWKLKSITYEPIDTIELRALLMNVKAELVSPDDVCATLNFKTEVGPTLVSVEYYPKVDIVAAHHNMLHGHYPYVERYRNYSDGTRIGPDLFHDFGHPVEFYASLSGHYHISGCDDTMLNKDIYRQDVENDKFCQYCIIDAGYYNTNAMAYDEKGNLYNGDDIFPCTLTCWPNKNSDNYEDVKRDFYNYRSSNLYDMDDDTTRMVMTMCKDVPIASSAHQFGKDTQSLQPGFYFTGVYSYPEPAVDGLSSRYSRTIDAELWPEGLKKSIIFYLQYLVIDGRIIHFNDECDYKYLTTRNSVSKTQWTVALESETEVSLYGATFMNKSKLTIHKIDGPEVIIFDRRHAHSIENNDQAELDNIKSRNTSRADFKNPDSRMPLPEGKYVKIDRRLPKSLENVVLSRTTKSF